MLGELSLASESIQPGLIILILNVVKMITRQNASSFVILT